MYTENQVIIMLWNISKHLNSALRSKEGELLNGETFPINML